MDDREKRREQSWYSVGLCRQYIFFQFPILHFRKKEENIYRLNFVPCVTGRMKDVCGTVLKLTYYFDMRSRNDIGFRDNI